MMFASLIARVGIATAVIAVAFASSPSASATPSSASAPTVSIGDVSDLENSGSVSVPVTLSASSAAPISVEYRTRSRTARAGVDYQRTQGSLVFAPGEMQSWVVVPIVDDTVAERSETFRVVLSEPRRAYLADRRATITVLDDDWHHAPTVTPSTDLVDRQVVRIQAKGLSAGLTIYPYECEPPSDPSSSYPGACDVQLGSATVDAHGRLDVTVPVLRFFRFYDDVVYDCAILHCALWLHIQPAGDGNAFGNVVPLSFRQTT